MTTWGPEGEEGQPVAVTLNGQNYQGGGVRFVFEGFHAPALLEAYFPPEATTLVLRFDSQATNRAGMNGQ
eukprot:1005270-Prymnesium_polylepis.1